MENVVLPIALLLSVRFLPSRLPKSLSEYPSDWDDTLQSYIPTAHSNSNPKLTLRLPPPLLFRIPDAQVIPR